MSRLTIAKYLIFFVLTGSILLAEGDGEHQSRLRRVVERTYEKSVYAKIKVTNGIIYINKANSAEVFNGEFIFTKRPPMIDYEIVGNQGRLTIRIADKKIKKRKREDWEEDEDYEIEIDEAYENECYLNFSPNVPLDLKMDFGVVKGELDLGGLRLEECEISTAVSKATIDFSEPNPIRLDELQIENGVGKLNVFNLGNANFSDFKFEGGVGKYVLDFDGTYTRDASADIEIGMGKLTVFLPNDIGVRIEVEKSFLSSLNIDKVYKEDDYYYNDLWNSGKPNLDIQIESGIAKIVIEWID